MMNRQTGWQQGVLVLLSAVSLSAAMADDRDVAAQTEAPAKAAVFSVHDRNQDGYLDRHEYHQMLEHRGGFWRSGGCDDRKKPSALLFDDVDTDANGYISEDEMVTSLSQRLRKHRRHRFHGGR